MKEDDMRAIGRMISSVIHEPESEDVKARVLREVLELTERFPMYQGRLKPQAGGANIAA